MKNKTFTSVSGKKYDGMMGRCYRESNPSFPNYGGRGIRVHGEWIKDINVFRSWLSAELEKMKVTHEDFIQNSRHYQLDRINVNGHYTPSNCQLVSPQRNTRNVRHRPKRTILDAEGNLIDF